MSAEARDRKSTSSPYGNDDAVKVLTDILNQVRAGIHLRPLSDQAVAAVERYNDLRRTLDHDLIRSSVGSV
jgi:hypothetical protein